MVARLEDLHGFSGDAVAVSPDGSRVYVVNTKADTVSVIDTTNYGVTTVALDPGGFQDLQPQGIAANASQVWTAERTTGVSPNTGAGVVGRFVVPSNTLGTAITGFTTPYAVAVGGTYLWVTDYSTKTVTVLDAPPWRSRVTRASPGVGVFFPRRSVRRH